MATLEEQKMKFYALIEDTNNPKLHPEMDFASNKEITGENYDHDMAIKCTNGTFVGRNHGDYKAWRGVPFALPPVGELRWKLPVPAPDGDKIYEAYCYAKKPIQYVDNSHTSEDCLYLNIFSSGEKTDAKKPVMVWIHGGGFMNEAASDILYLGQNFIRSNPDILLVTIEYRLNFFGFITFESVEGGEEYKETGMLGLYDQLCALKWIKKNIAAFGGDVDNITISGESAGSISCTLLPLIEKPNGLYHRVIAQSGAGTYAFPKKDRQFATDNLLRITGCRNMKELVALPAQTIIDHAFEIGGMACFAPIRNGKEIPFDVFDIVKKWVENTKDIDLMIGSNLHECRYILSGGVGFTGEQAPAFFRNSYERTKKRVEEKYIKLMDDFIANCPLETEWEKLERMYTILGYQVNTGAYAKAHSEAGRNTWVYDFRLPAQLDLAGAYHGAELEYLFAHLDHLAVFGRDDEITKQRSKDVQEIWTSFVKTGVPSLNGVPFKKYESTDRACIVIDRDGIGSKDHQIDSEVDPLMEALPISYLSLFDSFDFDPTKVED